MKTLTKKQRRQIYLKAAKKCLVIDSTSLYLCFIFSKMLGFDINDDTLPEFELFRPSETEQEGLSIWWKGDEYYQREVRCIACLLMAEMCKP